MIRSFSRRPIFTIVSALIATAIPALAAEPARMDEHRAIPVASIAIQREPEDPANGRYDWGPCVVFDNGLYRMWWVRLGGSGQGKRFPFRAALPDGTPFEFTYPDMGDRIYYAESRDGRTWHIDGADYTRPAADYGPDSRGPLLVLGPAESSQQHQHLADPCVIQVDGVWYCYAESCSEFVVKRGADGKIVVGDEYNNQIFVATSKDGRTWRQYPDDHDPRPIVPAPAENKKPGRQRYGLGQPSVFYRSGRFVMHYIDSCSGPGDFIVRIEADNPYFRNARTTARSLVAPAGSPPYPSGAVARFSQTDVRYLGDAFLLIRPTYQKGNMNLLTSSDGVFMSDLTAAQPGDVFPQILTQDDRGPEYQDRLYPRFLTDAAGQVRIENGNVIVYYGSGKDFKASCWTWDLRRAEIPWASIRVKR